MTETVANLAAFALIAAAAIGTAFAALVANRTEDKSRRVRIAIPVKTARHEDRRG